MPFLFFPFVGKAAYSCTLVDDITGQIQPNRVEFSRISALHSSIASPHRDGCTAHGEFNLERHHHLHQIRLDRHRTVQGNDQPHGHSFRVAEFHHFVCRIEHVGSSFDSLLPLLRIVGRHIALRNGVLFSYQCAAHTVTGNDLSPFDILVVIVNWESDTNAQPRPRHQGPSHSHQRHRSTEASRPVHDPVGARTLLRCTTRDDVTSWGVGDDGQLGRRGIGNCRR
mmetsp:Transcript_43196/g.91870  ORF Transcript_43196/g.91870 Transcript_43196/m.91870 type:complete len:225 (+) Transcript_43196:734-1408(+)